MLRDPAVVGLVMVVVVFVALFCGLGIGGVQAAKIVFTESQITSDVATQQNPDIYEYGQYNYSVVWEDNRNGNWDIYLYAPYLNNWSPEFRLTNSSGNEVNPRIYNDIVVYQSDRGGNWDIYIYNVSSRVETQITSGAQNEAEPAIYGNKIVWQDSRSGHWGIYMYDLTTHTEQLVYLDHWLSYNDINPEIYGDKIVWLESYSTSGRGEYWILCRDLSTDYKRIIASEVAGNAVLSSPAIYGDKVVWAVDDVNLKTSWDVKMVDLSTDAALNINFTNYIDDENPAVYVWSYSTYLVFERSSLLPGTKTDLYLYDCTSDTEYQVAGSGSNQIQPAISAKYSNLIVYTDDRNGARDIYLSAFGYIVGAEGPSSQSTSRGTGFLGDQGLMIASVAAVVVVVGAVVFVVVRRLKRKAEIMGNIPK
jgi:beta propeller repeat protein